MGEKERMEGKIETEGRTEDEREEGSDKKVSKKGDRIEDWRKLEWIVFVGAVATCQAGRIYVQLSTISLI